jgi:hypothetical protein
MEAPSATLVWQPIDMMSRILKAMKRFLSAMLVLALVGCNLPDPQEASRLKTENETLLAQVQSLTNERDAAVRERDDLQSRLQAIKDALENLPSVNSSSLPTTPDSSATTPATPDSSAAPVVPDSSAAPVVPDSSATTPAIPDSSAAPVVPETTPDSSAPPALPPVTASPDAPGLEQLKKYADDVLTAAQNFKAQTRQEAPSNCVNGYAAGAYNVQDTLDLKECTILSEANGDYRVTARDAAGNSVSLP